MRKGLFDIVTTTTFEVTEETVGDIIDGRMGQSYCFTGCDEYPLRTEIGEEGYIEVVGGNAMFIPSKSQGGGKFSLKREDKVVVTRKLQSETKRTERDRLPRGYNQGSKRGRV